MIHESWPKIFTVFNRIKNLVFRSFLPLRHCSHMTNIHNGWCCALFIWWVKATIKFKQQLQPPSMGPITFCYSIVNLFHLKYSNCIIVWKNFSSSSLIFFQWQHEKALHTLANSLLDCETLSSEEIRRILLPFSEERLSEQQQQQQPQDEEALALA